jgi:hypothetical protein
MKADGWITIILALVALGFTASQGFKVSAWVVFFWEFAVFFGVIWFLQRNLGQSESTTIGSIETKPPDPKRTYSLRSQRRARLVQELKQRHWQGQTEVYLNYHELGGDRAREFAKALRGVFTDAGWHVLGHIQSTRRPEHSVGVRIGRSNQGIRNFTVRAFRNVGFTATEIAMRDGPPRPIDVTVCEEPQ